MLIPLPPATAAAARLPLRSVSWSATDGFDSDFPSQINFIEFDEKAYRAVRDDLEGRRSSPRPSESPRGTPRRWSWIWARGPSVLALIAATAGQKKVYCEQILRPREPSLHREVRGPQCFEKDVDGLVPLSPV